MVTEVSFCAFVCGPGASVGIFSVHESQLLI